jgi:thiol:disulfide interchange protein
MKSSMIRSLAWLLPALVLAGCNQARDDGPSISSKAADGAFHAVSFDQAQSLAKEKDKLVMVDFYTDWCHWCKVLDDTTWKDPEVIRWLNDKTIAVKLDAERERALAKKYRIENFPTILFTKADGTEVGRIEGYLEPGVFQKEAEQVLAGRPTGE